MLQWPPLCRKKNEKRKWEKGDGFIFDAFERLAKVTDGEGNVTTYTYERTQIKGTHLFSL